MKTLQEQIDRAIVEHAYRKAKAFECLSLLERICWWLARHLPVRVLGHQGSPYLLRVYLYRGTWFKHRFLHYFFRGDADKELHNHPWHEASSLILTRGYTEYRLDLESEIMPKVEIRRLEPWQRNDLEWDTYHRIALDNGPCWTFFTPGRRIEAPEGEDWGFLDVGPLGALTYTPQGDFLKDRDHAHD